MHIFSNNFFRPGHPTHRPMYDRHWRGAECGESIKNQCLPLLVPVSLPGLHWHP